MQKKVRTLFIVLAIAGLVVPWYFNLSYFLSGGSIAPGVFFADATANALTTSLTWDVYIGAAAFSVGVMSDRTLGAWRWGYVAACFGIGLSFALPLYLAQRLRTGQPN